MKNILNLIFGVALALSFAGCDDEKDPIPRPASLPCDLIIGIFDNEGNNLLSESADGSWLYAPISISINDYPKK